MDNLIISMIKAYSENSEGLGFNKNDIDNFIKKYDYLDDISCNDLGYIILWKNKYIDDSKFSKLMEIEFKDDKLYIVCDNFYDILNMTKYKTIIEILNGDFDWDFYDSYENAVGLYWSDYNEDTMKAIYDFCIKKKLEIEGEVMTEENTKLEKNDVLFNDVSLNKYIDEDEGLYDLCSELNNSIAYAQQAADQNEIFEKVDKTFRSKIGDYEWNSEKLYLKIDKNIINEVEDYLKDFDEFVFNSAAYGSLLYILREMGKFDIRFPDLDNIYATIDDDFLNDVTQDRLSW